MKRERERERERKRTNHRLDNRLCSEACLEQGIIADERREIREERRLNLVVKQP
jgi:hypothetical protein